MHNAVYIMLMLTIAYDRSYFLSIMHTFIPRVSKYVVIMRCVVRVPPHNGTLAHRTHVRLLYGHVPGYGMEINMHITKSSSIP